MRWTLTCNSEISGWLKNEKLCIDVAAQMIQLFKIDDSNFHAIFQQLTNKYEAFDRKSLEIENRMVKYNQRLQSTNMFASKYQRYESQRKLYHWTRNFGKKNSLKNLRISKNFYTTESEIKFEVI